MIGGQSEKYRERKENEGGGRKEKTANTVLYEFL